MSTDIATALLHRAHIEAQVSKSNLTIVCLWAVTGLVVTALMIRLGYGAEIAVALATAS